MKIYVDIDDVLCETAASLCRIAEREFGKKVPYEKVFQFDLQDVFGLTDAEMARFMKLSHEPEALLSYEETPGAVTGVKALRDAGHEVEIVTGRPASSHETTRQWMHEHGLGDFAVTYVDKYGRDACYAHNPGDPPTVTLPQLLERRYDVVIDDSPKILDRLVGWGNTRILLFSRPWNQAYQLSSNMVRVKGWQEIASSSIKFRPEPPC